MKTNILLLILITALLSGCSNSTAQKTPAPLPQDFDLIWDASPAAEQIDHYNVKEKVGADWQVIDAVKEPLKQMSKVKPGNHTYMVTAVNASDMEGPAGNEVSIAVLATPSAVTTLRIQKK